MKKFWRLYSLYLEDWDVIMSVKLHFVQSHLDFFPDNMESVSNKQGEFHKAVAEMEKRYSKLNEKKMFIDYFWTLIWEISKEQCKRKMSIFFFMIDLFISLLR